MNYIELIIIVILAISGMVGFTFIIYRHNKALEQSASLWNYLNKRRKK